MIRNTSDGTDAPAALRCFLNLGTLNDLPAHSSAPKGEAEAVYQAIREAGYDGVQGGDTGVCAKLGLPNAGGARINKIGEADEAARASRDQGEICLTLHVAWGIEDDDEIDRLVDDILNASARHDQPMYIETHRATITDDMWRTVQLVKRFPDLRFNGDFSHWYTGHEMVYGGIENKLDFIQPVFERVRFMHGRIGNPGCMQVDIGNGKDRLYVDHFREMWTRSMTGFLRSAKPGDYLVFAPELLQAGNYYARAFPGADGKPIEESDRWEQATLYTQIAKECFAEAEKRV